MDERTMLTRRRTSLFRRIGWLAVAALATLALVGPAAGPAAAQNAGAIWTTAETCQSPAPQDQNLYQVGDTVHIRGSNLDPSTLHYWRIVAVNVQGKPVIASGTATTNADGYFCAAAHTIAAEEAGAEYSVDVDTSNDFHGAKNDNYRVAGAAPTTPPTEPPTTPPTEPPTTPPTEPPTEPPADPATLIVYKGLDIDGDGDPNTGEIVPAPDWTFDVSATGGTPAESQKVTGADGSATFVFDVTGEGVVVDVSEVLQQDYEFLRAYCTPDDETDVGTVGDGTVTDVPIAAGQMVECYFANTSGGTQEATATPKPVTPPPTDTLGLVGGAGSDSWRIVLLAMAGLLAAILLFTPAEKAVTRRRR